jgi:hypothetical protein
MIWWIRDRIKSLPGAGRKEKREDDCNKKWLSQPLTLTKGTRGDQDGTYAEMDMTYKEAWYKEQR